MKAIPYSRQSIDKDDIKAATRALRSDWLTQGPMVRKLEEAVSRYTGARYCAVLSSGTAALHLSMMALGIGSGDRVITSPITFSASANCAVYVGARPGFIDIDDRTYHLDTERLDHFLKVRSNRKGLKAVVAVHFMGTVSDIKEIKRLCGRYGIKVIEDAAHALGAGYMSDNKWLKVGSCSHSDVAILSFHPIKHITSGEGGAVLTNDKAVYERVLKFRHHGIIKNYSGASGSMRKFRNEGWFYDIPEVGFNYRITDFQCGLAVSQLKKLEDFVERRRQIASLYKSSFSDIGLIRLPHERKDTFASYHLYVIRVPGSKRGALYSYLRKKGISSQVNYIPVHLLDYYREHLGYGWGDFPAAERYFTECLSLPLYTSLSRTDQLRVIDAVRSFFKC